MLCSEKELSVGQDHEGIMILDPKIDIGLPINEIFADADTVFDLEITQTASTY